jgi:septum formation protein
MELKANSTNDINRGNGFSVPGATGFLYFMVKERKWQNLSETKIILASSSPRRKELIQRLGLPVEVVQNAVDETVDENLPPHVVVQTLAKRKMIAAWEKIGAKKDCIIISGDTIVVHNGDILGKPCDAGEAFRMLKRLQGETHTVYSGVASMHAETGKKIIDYRAVKVTMKPLSDRQIQRYIATGEPMDKAGAYGIQGLGATLIEKIEGDYFAVVGLPLALLSDMLSTLGVDVL